MPGSCRVSTFLGTMSPFFKTPTFLKSCPTTGWAAKICCKELCLGCKHNCNVEKNIMYTPHNKAKYTRSLQCPCVHHHNFCCASGRNGQFEKPSVLQSNRLLRGDLVWDFWHAEWAQLLCSAKHRPVVVTDPPYRQFRPKNINYH